MKIGIELEGMRKKILGKYHVRTQAGKVGVCSKSIANKEKNDLR